MLDLSSLDFEITEAIRGEINSLEPSLRKHMSGNETIKVTLSKTAPSVFLVHMQTHYLGEDIVSHHESHNFHKALELCKDHFVKQVDKKKDKTYKRN